MPQPDVLLNKLFKKMPGDLPDMPLFVKKMVWFLLLNPKSYLTEATPSNIVKKLLKELTKLSLKLLQITKSSLKVCY